MELPGRAIRAKLCNESWGNSKILIMTKKREEELLSLWSFTVELDSTLLLEDSTYQKLDEYSFFDFVKVES